MIVRMSKVEIAGPKELLLDVLDLVREQGVFQPEAECAHFVGRERRSALHGLIMDQRTAAERLYLDNLHQLTAEIITLLPPLEVRTSRLDPLAVLDTIAAGAEKHLGLCRQRCERRDALRRERDELRQYTVLLETIGTMVGDIDPDCDLEFIAVTLHDPAIIERLREVLDRLDGGEFSLSSTRAADGTVVGLIVAPADRTHAIKEMLSTEQLPEFPFPAALRDLPLPQRLQQVRERILALERELAELDALLAGFARQWLPLYRRVDQWLAERLGLLAAMSVVQETGLCFVILGWARCDAIPDLSARLRQRFDGAVVLEELQILEQDLELVPVSLKNPPYLKPFELFTRLLPLPRYSSWDPTPFIGFFFPLFFGLMLGDAGHGLILTVSALLVLREHTSGTLADGARILLVSASCAMLFGILFGEFFGEAGAEMIGLHPLIPQRSRAIMPMLIFSLALGGGHVIFGLILGLVTALRHGQRREAAGRVVTICLLLCLAALVVTLIVPSPWLLSRSILVATGVLIPLLFISGGFLAPLELLKHVGNIVSYARIMAIGLGSALLANSANQLAGLSGDLIVGAVAAVVLHAVAIVLGVFAPTIHALRLHFVEFFSKFVEHGGRSFQPLHK
jgi:V/A-type H+-transporting ATPase subunit I